MSLRKCCRWRGPTGRPVGLSMRNRIEHVQTTRPGRSAPAWRSWGWSRRCSPATRPRTCWMADRHWGPAQRGRVRAEKPAQPRRRVSLGLGLPGGGDRAHCPASTRRDAPARRRRTGSAGLVSRAAAERRGGRTRALPGGRPTRRGWEDRLGALAPGKLADVTILDRDILCHRPDGDLAGSRSWGRLAAASSCGAPRRSAERRQSRQVSTLNSAGAPGDRRGGSCRPLRLADDRDGRGVRTRTRLAQA